MQKYSLKDKITLIFATTFGLGYLPVSGTFGSMFPMALYLLIPNKIILWIIFLFHCAISIPVSAKTEKLLGKKDPSQVVIDEVVGQFIPLLICTPTRPEIIFLAFMLFRIFDALKIPPVDYFEKKGGGYGIVMDDVMAGIYTTGCVFILQKLF